METLEEKIARVLQEPVAVVPYDPRWPAMFHEEKDRLLSILPKELIKEPEVRHPVVRLRSAQAGRQPTRT